MQHSFPAFVRRAFSVVFCLVFGSTLPANASFHLMQIEQVIGGVNGDTTAQAVQLRTRTSGQIFVSEARLVAYDAAGTHPIIIKDFTTDVSNGTSGAHILVASANFAQYTSAPLSPDFTMANLIPASYLAAGRLTFEDDFGTILWSLSFGGSGYTGSTTGSTTNDADGNFGPSVSGALPSSGTKALRFQGASSAASTNNAADYALTSDAAVFTRNDGQSATVTAPTTPSLTVNDPVAVYEGNVGGTNQIKFNIRLSSASSQIVKVNFRTADGTAIADSDYENKSGTLTFNAGETSKLVSVNLIGDNTPELNEPFFLDLKTPVNATVADSRGVAYIRNDDGPQIFIDDATPVFEGNSGTTAQTFTVRLSAASTDTVKVDWATSNNTANGTDYTAASGSLTFLPGAPLSQTITVQIKGDITVEPTETYRVKLAHPAFATLGDSVAIGYIRNDDKTSATSRAANEPSQ